MLAGEFASTDPGDAWTQTEVFNSVFMPLSAALLPLARDVVALADDNRRLREALEQIRQHVNAQAEDDALWALYPFGEQPISEAYLQQELRRLHETVERAVLSAGQDGEQ